MGMLEMADAVFIMLPTTRQADLILGKVTTVAAVETVMCHREFFHLVPPGVRRLGCDRAVLVVRTRRRRCSRP